MGTTNAWNDISVGEANKKRTRDKQVAAAEARHDNIIKERPTMTPATPNPAATKKPKACSSRSLLFSPSSSPPRQNENRHSHVVRIPHHAIPPPPFV